MLVGSLSMLLVVIILTLDVDIGNLDVYLNHFKAGAVLNSVNDGFAKFIGDLNDRVAVLNNHR